MNLPGSWSVHGSFWNKRLFMNRGINLVHRDVESSVSCSDLRPLRWSLAMPTGQQPEGCASYKSKLFHGEASVARDLSSPL